MQVAIKGVPGSIMIRGKNVIDKQVIEYVFLKKYHLPPEETILSERPVILDLGSNIGSTLLDLCRRYPAAKIYGYEMDTSNYQLAVENCKAHKNIIVSNKAVWIKAGTVSYENQSRTDAFTINAEAKKDGSSDIESTTIPGIISENNLERIDYLKMDIEGAELKILDEQNIDWLERVMSLNIEFHNISESMLDHYQAKLEGKGFTTYKSANHWLSLLAYKKNQV